MRRFFPYGCGTAPWPTFMMPHAHRFNLPELFLRTYERTRARAGEIGYEVPPLQIGVPFAL